MTEFHASGEANAASEAVAPPQHWFADVLASDGGVVRVRPVTPNDADELQRFHGALSDRTRYLRYFGPYPRISEKDLYRSTHVDHRDRVGLVVTLGATIIAVGRYELLDRRDSRAAEVAFVVADEHQGRGLGSVLLEHLAGAAAENDIDTFVAEVLAENTMMVTVFREAGYQVERSRDGSVLHLEFAIDPTEALLSVRDSRERASEARSVGNLLAPRSVAVIGATPWAGRVGGAILDNLLSQTFQGPVFPVNPNRRAVRGVRAYATVRDIPDEVDLAVVAVPAEAIGSVLDDCMAKGVRGLVVLTAGFGETGDLGRAAEAELVASARVHGMRVVGPSALGIANTDPEVALNATLAQVLPTRGRIGFFCQSGPLGAAILAEAAARNLGLSTFVSAGNRADVSGNDLLQYWDTDPATEVILLYLESFGNPRKFSRIARRVARSKPIVAVSSGGRAQHSSPTDRSIVRDLFAQAGIVQVDTISELFDCAALLAYQPLPPGPELAVVGNSAALNDLAVSAARGEGLVAGDPVDLGPQARPEDYRDAILAALRSEHADAVLVVFAPPVPVSMASFAEAIRSAAELARDQRKPISTTFVAEQGIPNLLAARGMGATTEQGSIPSYPDPERAARALARVNRYARWRARPVSTTVARPDGIDSERARSLVTQWMGGSGGRTLTDMETVALLSCYGISVVEFREVHDTDSAVAAAQELGYPVAAKATSESWRRREDLSWVRLDLWRADAVRQAYTDLVELCGDPVLHIQKMAVKGVGCVLRVQDDPSFGSVIEFGLSGLIIEMLGDRAYHALPLSAEEAAALIDAPRAAPLLDGTPANPRVDKTALVQLAQRISALFDDLPQMRELSFEPVLASPHSAEILYAGARIGPEPSRFDTGPRRLT